MSKALTKKETTAVALPPELDGAWGEETYDNSDILIPRLLLMQGQSDFVASGKAKVGDIVKSTTGQVYGDATSPVSVIPLSMWKDLTVEKHNGKKWEYAYMEKTLKDSEREWTNKEGTWRRNTNLNFFVILAKDAGREQEALAAMEKGETPDVDAFVMPCHLKFTRTSYNTGKKLATHFAIMQQFKKPAAMKMFNLGAKRMDSDEGPYQVYTLEEGDKTPVEFMYTAKKWYDILAKSKNDVKVHDASVAEPEVLDAF